MIIFWTAGINKSLTANKHPFSKWMPIGGCSLFFEPFKKCVSGDLFPVAFFLFCSGLLTPIVKLLVSDPPGLDPREPFLVLFAVSLEYWVRRLLFVHCWKAPASRQRCCPSGTGRPQYSALTRPVYAKYRPQFLQRRTVMFRSTQRRKE